MFPFVSVTKNCVKELTLLFGNINCHKIDCRFLY